MITGLINWQYNEQMLMIILTDEFNSNNALPSQNLWVNLGRVKISLRDKVSSSRTNNKCANKIV